MGGAQSSSGSNSSSAEEDLKELENKFRGSGDLALLERAFSSLNASSSSANHAAPLPSQSLQDVFSLAPITIDESQYPELSQVISHLGRAMVDTFFDTERKQEISWVHLLQGLQKCSQVAGGNGLKLLFAVYSGSTQLAKGPSQTKVLEKAPLGSGTYFDMVGYLTGAQLMEFFWLCWLMMCSSRLPKDLKISDLPAFLPNLDSLLCGAVSVCDISKSKDPSSEQSGNLEKELPTNEVFPWVTSTLPGLSDCLLQYVRAKLERVSARTTTDSGDVEEAQPAAAPEVSAVEENPDKSKGKEESHEPPEKHTLLLHSGTAWAIGLSLRDSSSEILFRASCGLISSPDSEYPNLLYRSSVHGRGLNRFWTCVEGYAGLTLFLVSAHTAEEGSTTQGKAVVLGALISGGFANKESFYGASGSSLFALDPLFLPLNSTGREKNFVYSHKKAAGVAYRAQPKPEGVGFGGSAGKERIWIDEDFGTLTVRHHAVDKTYQAGSLVPNQGYGPITAKIVDIEVWGVGGKSADEEQARYLKRQNLFSEQRRKVDLKTMYGTWENSPEKMMMDMISNPNAPRHEEQ